MAYGDPSAQVWISGAWPRLPNRVSSENERIGGRRGHGTRSRVNWLFGAMIVGAVCVSVAAGGSVRLRDGKVYEGQVKLVDGGKVEVMTAQGVVRVAVGEVELATFDLPRPAAPASRPAVWEGKDIGAVRQAGSASREGTRIRISDGGTGVHSRAKSYDSFYYYYQRMPADGQIVARVMAFEGDQAGWSATRVGLMVRESLAVDSPFALVARGGDRAMSTFHIRREKAKDVEQVAASERGILGATWQKLVREGDRFTAYESVDGQEWVKLGSRSVPMVDQEVVYVGLASATYSEGQGWSLFDRVEVMAGPPPALEHVAQGILMTNGSLLACEVKKAEGASVVFERGTERSIPARDVSALIFRPATDAMLATLKEAKAGVLLSSGDFVEGELRSIENGRAKLSSVLFGLKDLDIRREVAGVSLRGVIAGKSQFEIELADHSMLKVMNLTVENGQVTLTDPMLELTVPAAQIAAIRAGK